MHYQELDKLLDSLAEAVDHENPQKGYWRDLWALVSRIRGEFKTTHYPNGKEKHDAIERLNNLVEAAGRRSEEEKQQRLEQTREWEKRIARSVRARCDIENKAAATRPTTDLERMIATVILIPLLVLEKALNTILGLEQVDEIREDLKACSTNMKDAWDLFSESKHDLLPGDKNELYKQLTGAQERLNAAWDRWKQAKNAAYEERCRASAVRQRERDEKHRDFVAHVEANIEKLEAKISKAEAALDRQRDHLSDLQDKYSDAWNEGFRDQCAAWIEESEERIRSIENSIDQWKKYLEQEHDKIRT